MKSGTAVAIVCPIIQSAIGALAGALVSAPKGRARGALIGGAIVGAFGLAGGLMLASDLNNNEKGTGLVLKTTP